MAQYHGDVEIKVNTISEVTSAAGVTVDGVLLIPGIIEYAKIV